MRGTTSESIHTAGVSEDADASEHLCRRGIVLRATVVFCWLPFLSALLLLDSLSQTVLTHTFFASHMSPPIHWSLVTRCDSFFERQRPADFLQESVVHRLRSLWFSTGVLPTSGKRLRQRFNRKESLFFCRIGIGCIVLSSTAVLVSSRNTKEPHDLPILCPASSRELHVSRALAHSHPNRKAHAHTNTTNVAEQQAALPRGVPGRRIKPAMRLENDFSLAPFIRQMSKPTRMTGTNRSLGIVCKHMFLTLLHMSCWSATCWTLRRRRTA